MLTVHHHNACITLGVINNATNRKHSSVLVRTLSLLVCVLGTSLDGFHNALEAVWHKGCFVE